MIIVILIVCGLALGSFVNALVWRLNIQSTADKTSISSNNHKVQAQPNHDRYSILTGRSMCPNCHHELAVEDLIPVLSWILLRGRCRYCGKAIAWQYPIVELLVMILFIVSYIWWPLGFSHIGVFSFVIWLIFLTAFVALAVYDLRWFLLPDRIVYPLIGLAVFELIVKATYFGGGWSIVTQAFWGVVFLAGIFYLLYIVSKGAWIGFGDVKLAIVLGLIVGGPLSSLLIIFIASSLGSVVVLPMLIRGSAKITTQIPFGPFLLGATLIVVLFGNHITDWYNNLFYLH